MFLTTSSLSPARVDVRRSSSRDTGRWDGETRAENDTEQQVREVLDIANAPVGQAGLAFVDEFIQILAEHCDADPEAARPAINTWVADQTRDRITDLLPLGSAEAVTRLMLVKTIFFEAQCVDAFDPGRTEPAPFTRLDDSRAEVEMMNARRTYGDGAGWQSVRLRYWGDYSMLAVVPDTDRFNEIGDHGRRGALHLRRLPPGHDRGREFGTTAMAVVPVVTAATTLDP
jgi:serpin B